MLPCPYQRQFAYSVQQQLPPFFLVSGNLMPAEVGVSIALEKLIHILETVRCSCTYTQESFE